MSFLTIFTPTYNRAATLLRLYDSLMRQTNKDFEWLVVDDGSADNTKVVVNNMKKTASFPITYVYQENHGKHVAINVGGGIAKGEWFFIVDSDDYLTEDAIEKIMFYCDEIRGKDNFAGVVGLRKKQNGEIWNEWPDGRKGNTEFLDQEYIDATAFEYRYKYGIVGDRAEVIKTELIRKYKFPVFDGERFLSEGYLWSSVAKDGYKFRWFNSAIYVTEYRDDGLSRNISNYNKDNPFGNMSINNLQLGCIEIPLKIRFKNSYNYYKYGRKAGKSFAELYKSCNCKMLSWFGIPLAVLRK